MMEDMRIERYFMAKAINFDISTLSCATFISSLGQNHEASEKFLISVTTLPMCSNSGAASFFYIRFRIPIHRRCIIEFLSDFLLQMNTIMMEIRQGWNWRKLFPIP